MPKLTAADKAQVTQSVKHARLVKASRRLARVVKTIHPSKESIKRSKRNESYLHTEREGA